MRCERCRSRSTLDGSAGLVASGIGCEQLEGDVASEFRVFSPVDLPHPTLTNFVEEAVMQQLTFWVHRTHLRLRGNSIGRTMICFPTTTRKASRKRTIDRLRRFI